MTLLAASRRSFARALVLLSAAVAVWVAAGAPGARAASSVVLQFGSSGTGDGEFSGPTAIAVDPSTDDVYVVDTGNRRVEKFDSSGSYLSQFAGPGSAFEAATGVAVDPATGNVYVLGSQDVGEFNSSGSYLTDFGSSGSGPGEFEQSQRIAFDAVNDEVYVTDSTLDRVEVFNSTGAYVTQFGSSGTGNGQFSDPFGVAADPQTGDVYVADSGNNRVEKFDAAGNYLSQFGSAGSGSGQFNAPTGIAVDPSDGDVYVSDHGGEQLQAFDSSGHYLGEVSASFSPDSLAVDPSTGDVYASDYDDDQVVKFSVSPSAPVLGQSADAAPVSGVVLIKPPGATTFVALKAGQQLALGSTFDATNGVVSLTAVDRQGQTTTGEFYAGAFRLTQKRSSAGELTVLTLAGPEPSGCGATTARVAVRKKRSLWGHATGNFETVGNAAAAIELGTKWLTEDTCEGTLIQVAQGAVSVDDFAQHHTFVLHAPSSYLARPAKGG
jgi:DNA-binding beta-propeller fold protein YncE